MADDKPQNLEEYHVWLQKKFDIELPSEIEQYYNLVSQNLRADFEGSPFWRTLLKELKNYDADYYVISKDFHLYGLDYKPVLHIKPYPSIIDKSYRKNVVDNNNWPAEPDGGWIFPDNWFERINDIVRTTIEVKYLDGVEFVCNRLRELCEKQGRECEITFEAREEGYYASHAVIKHEFKITHVNWTTKIILVSIEIQITTQLQELIKKLLHAHYEERRIEQKDFRKNNKKKWQWDYKCDEFATNYLGHILHYIEGMIMDVRDRRCRKVEEQCRRLEDLL